MIKFSEFLLEAKIKNENFLKTVPNMKDNVYVFIMGGTATGKNYLYSRLLGAMPLVDIDEYVKELTKGDESKRGKNVAKAIALVNADIGKKLVDKQSFVQTGSGSNFKGLFNRLKKAKDSGFKIVVVLVETDLEKAIERNKARVGKGGHGAFLSDEKIKRTRENASDNFELLKKSKVVDFAVKVKT